MTAVTYSFDWGFSDHTPQLSPLLDCERLYTEVAPLRPQLWRLNVPWNYVAKAKDPGAAVPGAVPPTTANRDWTVVDRCINDLILKVGCEVTLMIGQGRPQWGGWLFGWGATTGTPADFGNFCAEVAARYKPGGPGIRTDGIYAPNAGKGVRKFEMWNEVNNAHFWGSSVNPAEYTAFLAAGYAGIKSVPGMAGDNSTVIFCGMMHIPHSPPFWGSGWATMEEITFLNRCYDAAAKMGANSKLGNYFDAMAEHIYTDADTLTFLAGSTLGPKPDSTVNNLIQLRAIRDLMVQKGDGAKPIYITEGGFATHLVTEAQQSTYMQQLFNYLNTLPYIKGVFIYSARDAGTSGGGQDTYGMMTWQWTKRAIWSWLLTLTPTLNKVATPGPAVLTVIGSRPAMGITLRPAGAALTIVGSAPSVTVTLNRIAAPGPAVLSLTTAAPLIVLTAHQRIVPGPAALTVVGGAPTLGSVITVAPGPAVLALTTGTPVVTASAHKVAAPGPAAITIARGVPTVTVTGHRFVTPGPAALAITAAAPVVTVSDNKVATPGPAVLTVTGGTPLIALASNAIQVIAVGGGNSNGMLNATSVSLQFTIEVPAGVNRRIVSYVGAGTDNWVNAWSSLGASSSLRGAFTELTRQQYGNSAGYFQAVLGLYELALPDGPAETHTITISSTYTQAIKALMGNAIAIAGVGGRGLVQVQNVGTGAASAQSLTIPSGVTGDLVLVGIGASGAINRGGAWPAAAPGLWFSVEGSAAGDLDWMKLGYVIDPDGAPKSFTGTNTGSKHAMAGVRYTKA